MEVSFEQIWTKIMDYFLPVGQILGIGLAFVSLLQKSNRVANRLLAVLVLTVTYHQFLWYQFWLSPGQRSDILFRSGFPATILACTSLYLYVRRVTSNEPFSRWLDFSFVPVGIALLLVFLFRNTPVTEFEMEVRLAIAVIAFGTAIGFSAPHIRRFREEMKYCYSNTSKIPLRWIWLLLILLTVLIIAAGIDVLMLNTTYLGFISIAATLFNISVTLFALKMSPVFSLCLRDVKKSALRFFSEKELEKKKHLLEEELKLNRHYLKPELTLLELATALDMKPYQLTEVINRGFGMGFFDLINLYRVEAFKHNLSVPQYSHMNLVGIALESGFNSKSSFNSIFKKFTGLSPSQFQRNILLTGGQTT